ncbi:hypothetical protein QR680_000725 [Steinernema hermaphroditum]|uniref:RRM domain-containing protein n=1 Tax=Steinernema hermaphroditum TaxID=289476 RepID=A0AA39GXN4_9BILA|nr:hypothetical protein QR680_000725 [Steinernema hermaphroditum]
MSRVYVGRVPYRARESDLERFFRGYGRIREILMKNGYAFVEFSDVRDAEDAIHDLNGKTILSERVSVELAKGRPRYGGRASNDSAGDAKPKKEANRSRSSSVSPPPKRSKDDKDGKDRKEDKRSPSPVKDEKIRSPDARNSRSPSPEGRKSRSRSPRSPVADKKEQSRSRSRVSTWKKPKPFGSFRIGKVLAGTKSCAWTWQRSP